MLNAYPFVYSNTARANSSNHYFKAIHHYRFCTQSQNKYLVIVEEYDHHVFMLKFCLEHHQDNPDKFNELTHNGHAEARRIIDTCVGIGLSILTEQPLASFGFVASPTTLELATTGVHNTKRLEAYTHFARLFFPESSFTHTITTEFSVYFMLNKKYALQQPEALQKITEMLKKDMQAVVGTI